MKTNAAYVNESIPATRIILIDAEGNKKGEFLRDDAIQLAVQDGLDLVMVSPGDSPICKIMDYGKHLYHQKKRAKSNNGTQVKAKEIKMTPVTDQHDFEVKVAKIREFLTKNYKVKVTIEFKGRHNHHKNQGFEKCHAIMESLADIGEMDGDIQSIGQNMFMTLTAK